MSSLRRTLGEFLSDDGADPDTDPDSKALQVAADIARNPRTVTVRDGREIGYADVGDPDGTPLVVFHGFPNSRVFGAMFDEVGREYGVRIVAPERPGMGVSTPDPDRELTDWPDDVRDVADALGLGTFPVFGVSGGGPYAAVTAARCPDRVERAGIVCGLAPMASVGLRQRLWYYAARAVPPASKAGLWLLSRGVRRDREAFLEDVAESAAPADGPLWRGEVGKVLHASMIESTSNHGLDPLVRETAIYGSPWGFDLGDVEVPVHLWYGRADTIVPLQMGLYLTEHVPTAEAHVYPDLGHLSVVEENETEIVETLTGRRR
ncbi:alpha/beta fold hydrolase [Natronomonas marina]|uniref:alpha/beta fold hydrolase n=1 Tax=Natronomonas marina TaxID=2961939 RepID=UPI0020C9FFBB|nr:alpha/beta hydrolase [Natronomonas marina]